MNLMTLKKTTTLLFLCSSTLLAGDWSFWRGPHQTGASDDKETPTSWSTKGKNLVWKANFGCRSCPAVFDGRVFIINRVGAGKPSEQERVMCLDANTGKVIWEDRFNVYLTNIPNSRVGWANLLVDPETSYVYAHGVGGVFRCYDRDGKIIWSRSLTEELGRLSGYGGRTNSPNIAGDLLVISFTNSHWGPFNLPSHRYFGFNKLTGEIVYVSQPGGKFKNSTYSTVVVANHDGRQLVVDANSDGNLYAIKAQTGEKVWAFRLSASALQSSVVVAGGKVYATHGVENPEGGNVMGRVICVDLGTGKEVWRHDGIEAHYPSPVFGGGKLFIISNFGMLYCFDGAKGKLKWELKLGTLGKGSPIYADGKIYATTVDGGFHIVQVGEKKGKILDSEAFLIKLKDGKVRKPEVYGSPAVANGRIYLPTETAIYCIGKKGATSGSTATIGISDSVSVKVTRGGEPVHIQIVPGDTLVEAGGTEKFVARGFNANGDFIKEVKVTWNLGMLRGKISADGVYSPPANAGQAGFLTATFGKLTAKARVRYVPFGAWKENFDKLREGKAPSYFVASGKFALVKKDGNLMLKKPKPKGGLERSYGYIGPSSMKGYSIQADLLAEAYKRGMPDGGLINSRYIVDLRGNYQDIEIRTWPGSAPPRWKVEKPFDWDPKVWYTMKVRVDPAPASGKSARIRVKVWKKADKEPAGWTIDATDPCGNLGGSSGISGFTKFGDMYYDNLSVTMN